MQYTKPSCPGRHEPASSSSSSSVKDIPAATVGQASRHPLHNVTGQKNGPDVCVNPPIVVHSLNDDDDLIEVRAVHCLSDRIPVLNRNPYGDRRAGATVSE